MRRKLTSILLTSCMVMMSVVTTRAGGALESFDITGAGPSPIPGQLLARVIPIRWDTRSIPVPYRVNNTLNPIPNPLGAPFLSLADATTALQQSFDAWNSIPTSYINMQIIGTQSNPGLVGFDMINELTFRTAAGFNAIASSPSVNFIADVTLVNGDDIDGDGDSDVSNAIATMSDVDSDGDNEFPAGSYEAGTILDNDVQFNTKTSNGLRFTVDPAQADAITRSVDLKCVAVHEFGHSFGLSHVLDNQISKTDGNGSTMFPFIDTGDPAAELGQATPSADDIAFASFFYPEGTANAGPPALQSGDVRFNKVYGLIKGELDHGVLNQPIAGGQVRAVDRKTDENLVSAFSGTTNLSFNPVNGGLFFVPDVTQAIVNGNFTIPVPKGSYHVMVEPVDGQPAAPGNISFTAQIGNFFGQQNFIEEFYNGHFEDAVEFDPSDAKTINVNAGHVDSGIDITTNNVFTLAPFGNRNAIGFINPPPGGLIYAVVFPVSEITALNGGNLTLIQAGQFDTNVVDASVPVVFAKAYLTTGVLNPDTTATIDLAHPLDTKTMFVGQDGDFAPFYFDHLLLLNLKIHIGIATGKIQNLFLVLQIPPAPFPGVSGQPPLIGLNVTPPILGRSFLSTDGGLTFNRRNDLNFRFSLIASPLH